jgi:poly(A) polymerase
MKPLVNRNLPDAPWLNASGLKRVVSALTDGDARPRLVGGAVRDSLLGLPVADIDLATPILPKDVIIRLEQAGIKAIPTGIDHGTITAVADGQTYEITTLRRDVSNDGRRATVAFSDDWREDAARRDFTFNALYADPVSREIFDYFGGLDDLESGRLRFIGDADQRIAEDHLRILRYFRFLARFGGDTADAAALAACENAANNLMALSRERIASELMKIVSAAKPLFAVSLMIKGNIFATFLPELSPHAETNMARLLARESAANLIATPAARLLSLLPPDALAADKVAMRLKLSNRMRSDVAARLNPTLPITSANMHALAYYNDLSAAQDIALLFANDADVTDCLVQLAGWQVPEFTFKGGQLIQRGLTAGPLVARTLQAIEKKWAEGGFPSDGEFAALVDQEVALALLSAKNA